VIGGGGEVLEPRHGLVKLIGWGEASSLRHSGTSFAGSILPASGSLHLFLQTAPGRVESADRIYK